MNQVLTSWLLATSPRSWASSRRFCVGSSERSVASSSSAIVQCPFTEVRVPLQASLERYHVVHDGDEVVEEGSHHRRKHHGKDQETGKNRQRHANEIDLHLRHQPRQHAQSDIEDQTENQK